METEIEGDIQIGRDRERKRWKRWRERGKGEKVVGRENHRDRQR